MFTGLKTKKFDILDLMLKKILPFVLMLCIIGLGQPAQPTHADGPMPLSAWPRPKNDNGLSIHWHTGVYGQEDEVTDYFIAEIKAMNIKWVKFINDQTDGRDYDYMVKQLVANDIMPVMRIYSACNEPINLASLAKLVDHYVPMGLYYYELYNEPDIPGKDGGWCEDPEPDAAYLAGIWAPAAREIQAHGGYPSLPSIFPVGKKVNGWENSFFQQFLQAVKNQGNTAILYRSWGAVHNYFINHPPTYPEDDVNLTGRPLTAQEIKRYKLDEHQVYAMNQAREKQFEPGGYHLGDDPTQDVTHFRQFIAYHDQFTGLFGFEIPLISTEGGATIGSCEDPRYPCVNEEIQKEWTLAAYEYMLDEAPDYYFAFCTWLLAQKAADHFGGTVWEGNAWYHDRKGEHIAVVDALKNHPRKGEPSRTQKAVNNWEPSATQTELDPGALPTANISLAQYPRPANDNGRGIHYAPTALGQATEVVDRLVGELLDLNIKWVKIMQADIPKVEDRYLIEQLVENDIEPILRIYQPYNDPYENLTPLVASAHKMGVNYFELYNEPNISGFPGGWHDGEQISVDRILTLWIPAAETIKKEGGYPGLPTLAPGGSYEDMKFLGEFLDGLKDRGRTDLLEKAWIPLHNYFLNHPLDYPTDPVNLQSVPLTEAEIKARGLSAEQVQAINDARAREKVKSTYRVGETIHEDSNGFKKFEAYGKIFFDRFGYYIPIISTEGGAIAGDFQDPRYPPVTDDDVTNMTVSAYRAMLTDAPAYYFAFTPWLLANGAGSHWDPAWEGAAWYKVDGTHLPVVDALKADAGRHTARNWSAEIAALESTFAKPQTTRPATANAAKAPQMEAQSTKIVPANGKGAAWQIVSAEWKPSSTPYPRLYVDVYDAGGRLLLNQQIHVAWTGGWSLLIPGGESSHSVSMHLSNSADVYTIGIAGSKGQAVQARGAEGYSLYVAFKPMEIQ